MGLVQGTSANRLGGFQNEYFEESMCIGEIVSVYFHKKCLDSYNACFFCLNAAVCIVQGLFGGHGFMSTVWIRRYFCFGGLSFFTIKLLRAGELGSIFTPASYSKFLERGGFMKSSAIATRKTPNRKGYPKTRIDMYMYIHILCISSMWG